ncbi:MAG: LemA family protein [Propionibacteriaceae bacterium]|nr:LemA family protein [Propionibacteriaceae bacterium]
MIPALFAVIMVLAVASWAISTRNRFAALTNLVAESWRQIDVELQRRHDLVPNLVQVVSAYAQHEQALFASLAAARNQALSAGHTPNALSGPESTLGAGVGQVLAVAEAYPQLKASTHFLQLQRALVETEDRIAAERRFYNGNVRALNTLLDSFPASAMAGNTQHAEYFMLTSPLASQPVTLQLPS